MWFRKKLTTLAISASAALFAGCGFQPLHSSPGGAGFQRLGSVQIAPIPDRSGQVLYNFLRDRINPRGAPLQPVYVLSVGVRESQQSLGVRVDESATRANLKISATYRLRQVRVDTVLDEGTVQSTSSFNILRSNFATLSAENDARNRSLREISDEIRTRVAISLGRKE